MITQNFITSSANLYAPLNSVGQKPVGQEDSSSRIATTKPVEQLSSSGKQQLRTRDKYLAQDSGLEPASGDSRASPNQSEAQEARSEAERATRERQEKAQQQQDQLEIRELAARDREVRAHERAHTAVGGQYAGSPTYQYTRGPDGVNYASSGEVPIDVGRAPTPEETIRKAQIVRRAALAPAEPSPQDRSVAAQATQLEAQAQRELAIQRQSEAAQEREARTAEDGEERDSPSGLDSAEIDLTPRTATANSNPAVQAQNQITSRSLASPINTSAEASYQLLRLQQSIASTSPTPNRTGSILNQIA
ncbi:hypothetical protein TDB9533_01457 [Thalassocella blandensis]|nr:hypothetical protein TDB9533_01457 [Thalassocella blandensis]